MVTRTPLLVYVWNRYGKATSKKEAVVELRITYERRQKYISTGFRSLKENPLVLMADVTLGIEEPCVLL